MNSERRHKLQKLAIVSACMLLVMCAGLPWYWGNISAYTLSYIVTKLKSTSGVEAPWVVSLFTVSEMASVMAYGLIFTKYIDRRWLVLAGVAISETSLFMTYFAIRSSYFWLVLTMGISFGFGNGLLYANGIHLIVEFADKDMGLLTSLFQSSFTFGALIINKAVTDYVNSNNESPGLKIGSMAYFDQDSVLSNVPTMYILFGCFTLIAYAVGLLLLQCHPSMRLIRLGGFLGLTDDADDVEMGDTVTIKPKEELSEGSYDSMASDEKNAVDKTGVKEEKEMKVNNDYSPSEMLRTSTFYILWFSFFVSDIAFFLLTNYYKSYGQIYIHDDYFLTDLGTALIFVSMMARMVWGVLIDKFGLKVCLSVIASSVVSLNFVYYFMPMLNRYLYLFSTALYGSFTGSLYNIYLAATAMIFGKKHASTNFSIMMTAAVAFNIIAPLTLELLLTYFGWFATFTGSSVLSLISLILILVFFQPFDVKKEL